jgi:hypothetical protein
VIAIKKRYVWGLIVLFSTAITLFPISIIHANRVAKRSEDNAIKAVRQSQRVMCEAFDLIHQGHVAEPPLTDAGKKFAQVIQNIRIKYGCEDK